MGIYIILFELLMIILYAVFIRTNTTLTGTIDLSNAIYFIIAYTVVHFKSRMTDWSTLVHLLYITAVTLQLNTLFIIFWYDCFAKSFSATTIVTTSIVAIGFQCVLAIIVTYIQFIGHINTVHVFVICLFQIFAFALNFSISQFGIGSISAGGGMTIFLFGLLFAVPIRRLCFNKPLTKSKERYPTLMLKILALVVVVGTWPSFNYATATVDNNLLLSLSTTANLANQAFLQTLLALMSCIAISIGLWIFGQKIKLDKFVQGIIGTGILIASSASLIIDPFASLFLGMCGPLICFLIDKYGESLKTEGYSIDTIIIAALGGIFSAIFAAGRNNRTPTLVQNPLKQGGLQLGCLFLSAALALLFGFLTALILRCLIKQGEEFRDTSLWLIPQENIPLYPDDPIFENIFSMEKQKRLKEDNLLFNLKQSYMQDKAKANVQLGKILKQKMNDTTFS